MNIYAVRDRLIDYYMQPFVGPSDKEVMSALARTVNNTGDTNGITQAPHHFELWELGKVDDEGNITPTRKLVCDCASLIRAGVRTPTVRHRQETEHHPGSEPSPPGGDRGRAHTGTGALPNPPQTADSATAEVPRTHRGGYPPPSDG